MVDEPRSSLVADFENYFDIVLALSPEWKKKVYSVRYRVYCDEFHYEAVDKYPDQLESDEFDASSLHGLVIHKRTGQAAGCVRLVPAIDEKGRQRPLPFEKHCPESIDQDQIQSLQIEPDQACEISRLAVDRLFRRRPGEELTRFGDIDSMNFSHQEQRTFSLIAVSCFLAATAMTSISNRTQVFAMMEPFLPRLLNRSGIIFRKVGYDVDFRGIRAPYFIRTQAALATMKGDLKHLYQWIYRQIEQDLRNHLNAPDNI